MNKYFIEWIPWNLYPIFKKIILKLVSKAWQQKIISFVAFIRVDKISTCKICKIEIMNKKRCYQLK